VLVLAPTEEDHSSVQRIKLGVIGIALCALFALVSTATAGSPGVRITSLPGHVAQGGLEHLNATVSKGSEKCSLTVRYANGKKQVLGRKPVLGRRVAWAWQVPRTAAVGTAHAQVSCPGVGARTGTFRVIRAAKVVVTRSGFTEHTINGSGTTISYGLALVNRSPNADASDIDIQVVLLDSAGHVIDRFDQFILGRIRAGTTFYAGGYAFAGELVTHIAFSVIGWSTQPSSLAPPTITNLQVSTAHDGSVLLDGDITNEATKNLSSASELEAVFFNTAGQIIGGTQKPLGVEVLPGAQAPFELTSLLVPQASDVAQTKFDVAPHYANY
jgi:hypothetical protein